MRFLAVLLVLLTTSTLPTEAQQAVPAVPADPHQARPAVPVVPDSITPRAQVAQPATPASTNATSSNMPAAAAVQISVIADSSLKLVLQELAQAWADSQDSSPQVPLTLTNAGTLRVKVENGPAWDVVISADVGDVKELTSKGLLFADDQRSLARNTLVVYGRKALVKDDDLEWFDLIGTEWKKVALGSADLVESGRVAQRALQKHGLLDDDHKGDFIYAQTEAQALAAVQRDQAEAVFFYKTDAARIQIPGFDLFPVATEDAPPIFYVAAVGKLAKNPTLARAFIDFCGSEPAKAIWAKYGFETN